MDINEFKKFAKGCRDLPMVDVIEALYKLAENDIDLAVRVGKDNGRDIDFRYYDNLEEAIDILFKCDMQNSWRVDRMEVLSFAIASIKCQVTIRLYTALQAA